MLLYAIEISTHNLLVSQGEYSKASWQWQHQCQDLENQPINTLFTTGLIFLPPLLNYRFN